MDDSETLHRRARLRELVSNAFGGEQKALLQHIFEKTGKRANQGEMSLLMRDNSGKSFGDKKAKTLTEQIGLPRRWFDLPVGSEPMWGDRSETSTNSQPTTTVIVGEPRAPRYTPLEEASAKECIALLTDFSSLSEKKRNAVKKLAHDLKTGSINNHTPLYGLEEINRAIQASLFPASGSASAQQQQELRHTLDEISKLLRMQKEALFVRTDAENRRKAREI